MSIERDGNLMLWSLKTVLPMFFFLDDVRDRSPSEIIDVVGHFTAGDLFISKLTERQYSDLLAYCYKNKLDTIVVEYITLRKKGKKED